MKFIAVSAVFLASLALAHGPGNVDDDVSIISPVAPKPLPALIRPAPPLNPPKIGGEYAYLACAQASDCALKTVKACCGGTVSRCMNSAMPATLGNCRAGTMGICVMNPPGPVSCGCQENRCVGINL